MFCALFQYQMEAEQLSETLTKLNNSVDPKVVSQRSNSETLLQLEVQRNGYIVLYVAKGIQLAPPCGENTL